MEPMMIVWLSLLILFCIIEAATPQLISIWFAIGSLAALITALLNGSVLLQLVLFAAVSILLLLITRPLYRKYVQPKKVATNLDALIGKEVSVTAEIDNVAATGAVKVDAMPWTARAKEPEGKIPAGTLVRIVSISGVKLIVEPVFVPAEEKQPAVL